VCGFSRRAPANQQAEHDDGGEPNHPNSLAVSSTPVHSARVAVKPHR
jgi:hypothetical protein